MAYFLGIDFGGGASKATLLQEDGVVCAAHTVEYPTRYPAPGACEQRPADWIAALCVNTAALLGDSGVRPDEIAAVVVDSATHTAVVCDGDGEPLRDAIHWTDTRSRLQAERLNEAQGARIFETTFHRPDAIWTLPQLLWLRETEPDCFARIRRVCFEKDYIRFFLTGEWCTDRIDAAGSMLFDCRTFRWDAELCALAGLDPACLPPVREPTDPAGSVTLRAAKATGLAVGTPVFCGTTDTVLEVFAAGAVKKGDRTVKLATAGRICVITDRPCPDRHLVNYPHIAPGLWYPGTATKAAAASFRWYRDTFGGDYAALDEAAAEIAPGSEGLFFHPYLNGELTPYADPTLCGSFTGLRATHGKAHFTRAVLEGVAFSLLDSKRYLDGLHLTGSDAPAVLLGGGAKSPLWRQITADVLGLPLKTTASSDSSLGAAMLAGLAVGCWSTPAQAVACCVRETGLTEPDPARTREYAALFETYRAIHDALAPIYRAREA